jgi:O-antigen ligase
MSAGVRCLIPLYLALCVILGGASAGGYAANALLQLLATGLLVLASLARPEPPPERAERALLVMAGAVLVLACLQFVPLPPGIWRELPGRAMIARPFEAAGIDFGQGYVSLIPQESLKSVIWLLPAAGVLVTMIYARALFSGRYIAIAVTAAMCVSVFVGAMQLAAGQGSHLYFYQITNRDSAVGFFANANHMASLLLVTIPFQAALLHEGLEREGSGRMAIIGAIVASLAVTVTGIFVVGSLAGYGMLLPVGLASALIVRGTRRMRITAALLVPAVVLAGLALVLATQEGGAMLDHSSDMAAGSRHAIYVTTWGALRQYWPAGTGIGTFAEIYRSFENPRGVTLVFINHAHNDYLELLLETGAAGLVLMLVFLAWWVTRAWRIWREGSLSPFAMAGAIASATLMVHSLVDYPLRTAALSSVFAACLALMAAPRRRRQSKERDAVYGGQMDAGEPARTQSEGRSRRRRRRSR